MTYNELFTGYPRRVKNVYSNRKKAAEVYF